MKKKKLVIFLLVAIMVLTLAVTALVGCKPGEDDDETPIDTNDAPEGYKTMAATGLSTALKSALYNTAEDELVNNLTANAQLRVSTTYGDSTKEYLIRLGAKVALNTEDEDTSSFSLSIVDAKANNANIINVYYVESQSNYVYVDLGSGDNAKHYVINGVSIKDVLSDENKTVTDDQAGTINTDVTDSIANICGYFDTIAALGNLYQSNDNNTLLLRIDLDAIFTMAGPMLSIIDPITEGIGLDLKGADIQSILPGITIDLSFKMEGVTADDGFKNSILAGIDAKLGVSSKDIRIKRVDNTDFIRVNIAKDCTIDLAFDFKFGGTPTIYTPLGGSDDYTDVISAISFSANGELILNEKIEASFQLSKDSDPISIALEAGEYNIKVAADIDPTGLIGMQFNTDGSLDSIVGLVSNILTRAVKLLDLEITPKDNTRTDKLVLKVAPNAARELVINVDISLLGAESLTGAVNLVNGAKVSDLVSVVNSVVSLLKLDTSGGNNNSGSGNNDSTDASGNGSGETGSGNDAILAAVKNVIENLSIEVNGGRMTITLKDQVVSANEGKDDTTLSVSVTADSNGLTIDAVLKNTLIDGNVADVFANIKVDSNGVTITASAPDLILNGADFPIDLVIKLTDFTIGKVA